MKNKSLYALIFLLLIGLCNPLYANIGLPLIMITWPLMFIAFVPIIIIEAIFYKKIFLIDQKK